MMVRHKFLWSAKLLPGGGGGGGGACVRSELADIRKFLTFTFFSCSVLFSELKQGHRSTKDYFWFSYLSRKAKYQF
jgi:hypothetical protein